MYDDFEGALEGYETVSATALRCLEVANPERKTNERTP